MTCSEAERKFGEYWDMSEHDMERMAIDRHLLECSDCAEQFRLWEESEELIRDLIEEEPFFNEEEPFATATEHVNRKVMDRIYAEQSWLMPGPHKSHQFSKNFRRNVAIIVAACMAMFACAFFVFVFDGSSSDSSKEIAELTGLMDTANVSGEGVVVKAGFLSGIPGASISDPFVLEVVPAFPQYYVALSLLGIMMTLLILNWLSRTRE